jgi:glycolate oxidase FAD binding subunit
MTQTSSHLIQWNDLSARQQALLRQAIPNTEIVGTAIPTTQQELADTIRMANAENWHILPYGNGSKLDWGGLIQSDRPILTVQTTQINRLIEHAVGDMTVTVEIGMRLADLQATLAQANQFFPVDARFSDQATIGGVIATADAGSLRHRYSGVRDLLLGVTFVRSDGELVKAGGRVVKNVAGYDLMKLLTGSYGSLGVISQVTLRVYPIQPVTQTLVVTGDASKLRDLAQQVLNSVLTPVAIDWLSPQAMTDLGLRSDLGLIIRFQTVAESVIEQSHRIKELAHALDIQAIVYPEVDEAELWRGINTIGETGNIICKIGAKGTAAVEILQRITTIAPQSSVIIHASSGLGRLMLDPGLDAAESLGKIRSTCEANGGFLSILRGPIELKQKTDVWGYPGNATELMRTVKQQFDPKNLFSPGRFVS